jgi:hypothetical protein
MSPAFWELKATQLRPYRWQLGGATLLGFLMMGAAGFLGNRAVLIAAVAVGFPTIAIAWGLFCAIAWFEPSKGSLRPDSWLGKHVRPLNVLARWWGAMMLPVFFAAGVLGTIWWVHGVLSAP